MVAPFFLFIGLVNLVSTTNLLGIAQVSPDQFTLNLYTRNGTSTFINNITTIDGTVLTNAFSWIPHKNALALITYNLDQYSYHVYLIDPKGLILTSWNYTNILFSNMQYDNNTKQLFLIGLDQDSQKYSLYELSVDSGDLIPVVDLPFTPAVGVSSYCPVGHIFFVGVENDAGGSLGKINTHTKNVTEVPLVDSLILINWDYSNTTMYAWVTGTQWMTMDLIILNITSGERTKLLAEFTDTPGVGSTVLDINNAAIYASLVDNTGTDNFPVWLQMNLLSSNYSSSKTDPKLGFPINLALWR